VTHEWREPFVFQVPLVEFAETVSDTEAAESTRALHALPTVFAEEFADWQPQYSVEISEAAPAATQPAKPVIDEASLRFLKVVLQNPGRASSAYPRLAGLGAQQALKIRTRLVEAGFLREHRVTTGSRGRQSIVLEPLPPAYEVVANSGDIS